MKDPRLKLSSSLRGRAYSNDLDISGSLTIGVKLEFDKDIKLEPQAFVASNGDKFEFIAIVRTSNGRTVASLERASKKPSCFEEGTEFTALFSDCKTSGDVYDTLVANRAEIKGIVLIDQKEINGQKHRLWGMF